MTRQQIKDEIARLVKESSPASCRVQVAPLGKMRAVFITFQPKESLNVTWRLLYKAPSYTALLKKAREHANPS